MSTPLQAGSVAPAPFQVYSVHFDFPGGQAIKLVDPAINQPNPNQPITLGATPEWVVGGRDELSAYVRRTRPSLQVVFRATPAANGTHTVGANGTLLQVAEQSVTLAFDPAHSLSAPVDFQAANDLPDQIGLHAAKLDWYVRLQPAPSPCHPAGTSTHRIATTWRPFVTPPAGETGLPGWVYSPLMGWTCQWAAGLNDELAICNAIIRNLGSSGLQYGVRATDVREMLLNRGAMCGVWYQAFQQMAHCQGVFVYRRRFLVDRRPMPHNEEHWCAIVICAGGLGRAVPNDQPMLFNDNHTGFPVPVGGVSIVTVNERRWRFWCVPGFIYDGHCINFLVHNGGLYLYDACFRAAPIQVNAPLPANNTNVVQGGADLAPFKAAYFDGAINYMLGSIRNGANFLQTIFPNVNGMTVRTVDIPEVVNGNPGLTFRWGD
jgi:hypothetical protein